MPRFTSVTPTFNPMDFQTRIAPLMQYKEEYDKRMDTLDEQGMLADAIGGLIDEHKDPELAQMYKDYDKKMNDTVANLLSTGDLSSSRRALRELRRDYANKLVPIQQAYNDRAKAIENYDKSVASDSSYIGVDPRSYGLSSFMNGNSPSNHSVSGDKLYSVAMNSTKAASARNILYNKWGLDRDLLGQYFGRHITSGFNQESVQEALKKLARDRGVDPSTITGENAREVAGALSAIREATNEAMNMYGVDKLANDQLKERAYQAALTGAVTGIGYADTYDKVKNEDHITAYQRAVLDKSKDDKSQRDSWRTTSRMFIPQKTEIGRIGRSSIKEFDEPIVDEVTGRIIRNPLEAYLFLQEEAPDERYRYAGTAHSNMMWGADKNKYYQSSDEYKRRQQLIGDLAMSKQDYDKLSSSFGIKNGDNLNAENIASALLSDSDYNEPIAYNSHNIANSGYLSKLKEDMLSTINSNAATGKNVGKKEIYRTSDGVHADGKAIKADESIFDKDKVESIDASPFGIANGFITITHKDGKQYLVPIDLLGNESGTMVYNPDVYKYLLSGSLTQDTMAEIDELLHNNIVSLQQGFGHNFYQSQPTTTSYGIPQPE